MENEPEDILPDVKCLKCGELCSVEEVGNFDYSGTHCNNGQAGTHHTGLYASDCCEAEFEEV